MQRDASFPSDAYPSKVKYVRKSKDINCALEEPSNELGGGALNELTQRLAAVSVSTESHAEPSTPLSHSSEKDNVLPRNPSGTASEDELADREAGNSPSSVMSNNDAAEVRRSLASMISEASQFDYDTYHRRQNSAGKTFIIYTVPAAIYELPNPTKAIARLEVGSSFTPVSAISGWKHMEEGHYVIDAEYWTDQVLKISKIIGHDLESNTTKDWGVSGRYQACHAEKQLVAYFIRKHVFEDEMRKMQMKTKHLLTNAFEESATRQAFEEKCNEILPNDYMRLLGLWADPPRSSIHHGLIFVNYKTCPDCFNFIKKVEQMYGLSFDVRYQKPITNGTTPWCVL
ncbi:MAG: hypothetical protein M1819_003820 [Sarea resinae]|nr:MAG: hypothetical protein M1819_003820 [Sarea resinae]